jgi:uncharacterized protein YdaU (DUF1376 family)
MNKPPAFQFYPDDFLGGTMNFTDAELGLYVRLLCIQWSQGSLPDDDSELLSYSKGRTSVTRVKAKFKKGQDGLLRNDRLEQERCKQAAYRQSRSANGKHGGRPCKAHENHMVLKTKAQESSPSPSPSPTPLDITNVISIDRPDPNILEIYQAYPRRVGKTAALKAIAKAAKNCPELLAKTTAYAAAVSQWSQNERQYIPHPSTWFNRGSFDDDPETWQRQADTKGRASFA